VPNTPAVSDAERLVPRFDAVLPLLPGIVARLRGERFEGKKVVFRDED